MRNLKIKVGTKAYKIIMDGGFSLDAVSTYFAPASGPRWLVASGFDLSLIKNNSLGRKKLALLVGASSGAWRMSAWIQPQADICYHNLLEAYSTIICTREETPQTLLGSLQKVMNSYIEVDALPFALKHSNFRVAFLTSRAKHILSSDNPIIQKTALGICFLANMYSSEWIHHFFERMVFYSGVRPPAFCLRPDYRGSFTHLSEENFKASLLASGAIPLVVPGQRNIYGTPKGTYRDGGMTDYNISQQYAATADDIVLFFNHQECIVPNWMDKKLTQRRAKDEHMDNLIMVHPSEDFISKLPDGKAPDRDDFVTYVDDNPLRIAKWKEAIALSANLGEEFLELVESGNIKKYLELFQPSMIVS